MLGVETNTVSNWETGATKPTKHLAALHDILELDPASPVADIRDVTDDELFRRAREVDSEIERRFFGRREEDRPPPGSTGHVPRLPDNPSEGDPGHPDAPAR